MITSKSMEGNYLTELTNGFCKVYANSEDDPKHLHPTEFVETALSACMNITTRMVLDRMSLKYDEVIVKVWVESATKEETTIKYNIDIKGDTDESVKRQIISKVYNCPMRKLLTSNIKVEEDS